MKNDLPPAFDFQISNCELTWSGLIVVLSSHKQAEELRLSHYGIDDRNSHPISLICLCWLHYSEVLRIDFSSRESTT